MGMEGPNYNKEESSGLKVEQSPGYSHEEVASGIEKLKQGAGVDELERKGSVGFDIPKKQEKILEYRKRLMNKILKNASAFTENEEGDKVGWLPMTKVFDIILSPGKGTYVSENDSVNPDEYSGYYPNKNYGLVVPASTLKEIVEEIGRANPKWVSDIKISGINRKCYSHDLIMNLVEYLRNVKYISDEEYLDLYGAEKTLGVGTDKILEYVKTHDIPSGQSIIGRKGYFISKCFTRNLVEEMRGYFSKITN